MSYDYSKLTYIVEGRGDFSLTDALRLWKTKYPELEDFKKDIVTHEGVIDFYEFVASIWKTIKPVSVTEALKQSNAEIRRVYFSCIGVRKLFSDLKPEMKDRQVIKKKRTKWDNNNDPIEYEFEDVYELYEIPGNKLFEKNEWGREAASIFAVRCWCTTTNREYWLYVNDEAAMGSSRWNGGNKEYDAIQAIAWTIRIDVPKSSLEKIYRQGDIIIAKLKAGAKVAETTLRPYHLSKQQYLDLMYSET